MVAYNFKARFIDPIRAGTKDQTIRVNRAGRSRHARENEALALYRGMRTKHCFLIAKARCRLVRPIQLVFGRKPAVIIGARLDPETYAISQEGLDAFATRDGFKDWDDLCAFWRKEHGALDQFEGTLIRWKDLRI